MTEIETKTFFLNVLDDLRNKCDSNSNYNYVKAAGLIRQLLFDGSPLIDVVNREYKEKIIFEVVKETPAPPRKYKGKDGLVYETMMSVGFINPSKDSITEKLNRSQFLKHRFMTYEGKDITVLDILKLNAHFKGGVHFDNKPKETIDELLIDMANSAVNYTSDITGGAYAVHEIGKITLKALTPIEEMIKSEFAIKKK